MSYLSAKKIVNSNIHWNFNTEQLTYQDPYITTNGIMICVSDVSVSKEPTHYKLYLHSKKDVKRIYEIYDHLHKTYPSIHQLSHIPIISLSRNTLTDTYFKDIPSHTHTQFHIIFKYLKHKPTYSRIITHVSL